MTSSVATSKSLSSLWLSSHICKIETMQPSNYTEFLCWQVIFVSCSLPSGSHTHFAKQHWKSHVLEWHVLKSVCQWGFQKNIAISAEQASPTYRSPSKFSPYTGTLLPPPHSQSNCGSSTTFLESAFKFSSLTLSHFLIALQFCCALVPD